MTNIDSFDKALLQELQNDATLSLQELSERINLSRNAIWRRLTRLESEGFIKEKVARLDKEKLNLGLAVFISVKTHTHEVEWFEEFHRVVSEIPEITGMYRMTGDVDYVLHAFVPDMRSYDRLYKQLTSKVALSDVSSSFVMEEIKDTTKVPLTYI